MAWDGNTYPADSVKLSNKATLILQIWASGHLQSILITHLYLGVAKMKITYLMLAICYAKYIWLNRQLTQNTVKCTETIKFVTPPKFNRSLILTLTLNLICTITRRVGRPENQISEHVKNWLALFLLMLYTCNADCNYEFKYANRRRCLNDNGTSAHAIFNKVEYHAYASLLIL